MGGRYNTVVLCRSKAHPKRTLFKIDLTFDYSKKYLKLSLTILLATGQTYIYLLQTKVSRFAIKRTLNGKLTRYGIHENNKYWFVKSKVRIILLLIRIDDTQLENIFHNDDLNK